ncbi:MAG: hypothetical protein EBU08_07780 [Micrococcales bacterium]|nr:hypothetical protein [Micrococcales bacterium]
MAIKPTIATLLLTLGFALSSAATRADYICGDNKNNSLSFSSPVSRNSPPKTMHFNSDQLAFCNISGNVLLYRKECKNNTSTIIRFDLVMLELMLNEKPSQITMRCVKKHNRIERL